MAVSGQQPGSGPVRPEPFRASGVRGSTVPELVRHLARQIQRGVWPPNTRMPSQRDLMEMMGVSDTTVKGAYSALVDSGILENRRQAGFHVTAGSLAIVDSMVETIIDPGYPDQAIVPPSNPALSPPLARGIQNVQIDRPLTAGRAWIRDLHVRHEMADPQISAVLGATEVVARHRLLVDRNGVPVELRSSFLPAVLASGTPLAGEVEMPGEWLSMLPTYLGVVLAETRITVEARTGADWECHALVIQPHAMVIQRDTLAVDQAGVVCDLTRCVWPAAHVRILAETQLSP